MRTNVVIELLLRCPVKILTQKYNQTIFSENWIFDNVHVFGECIKIGLRKKELPNI